jgi:large conductance mechanosensitive channel
MSLVKEFKTFLARGNVIDLAIAVVLGAAFSAIVQAIVTGLIMPLVGKVLPGGDWQTWAPGGFALGSVLAATINFIVVALVVFVVAVKVVGALFKKAPPAVTTKECAQCLEAIPLAAVRCRACASPVEAPPPASVSKV